MNPGPNASAPVPRDPIDALMEEHQFILEFLGAAEGYAAALRRSRTVGSPPTRADLGSIAAFIREYADTRHHGKEEDILFAALLDHGFSKEMGPVAAMLADHETGRSFVQTMRTAAAREGDWREEEIREVGGALLGYAELLQAHIWKEDNILYPAARQTLDGPTYGEVARRCAGMDAAHAATGEEARLLALGRELIAKYAGGR
jgi:hemerythrin-like domain-containing protein